MRISEIILENQLDEKVSATLTIRDAKKILSKLGFAPTGRTKGSHDVWKDAQGLLFTVPIHGKELEFGVTKNLNRLMRDRGLTLAECNLDEAMALPGDPSTLLSLLSEMANMLGSGGTKNDIGPLRSAIMQAFNNGSAEDGDQFEKQLNFRLGSIRSMWMAKNWPQLKNCFLRLKKNPSYQRSIKSLDVLGDWPVFLIKDPKDKGPTLSKYFTSILTYAPPILTDMARFEKEPHVSDRAKHLSKLLPERLNEFNRFKDYWVNEYDNEMAGPQAAPQQKDELKGQQAAGAEDIISKVLSALPPKLAAEIRPQISRMGSQNDKLMYIMQALQKAGIDPHKVLG